MAFTGFTRETLYTPVPNSLLGEVLEQIQDLAELKVTLRGLWLLNRKQVPLRALSLDEFLGDRSLVNGLQQPDKDGAEEVRRGLRLAVGRGTFLTHKSETAGVLVPPEQRRGTPFAGPVEGIFCAAFPAPARRCGARPGGPRREAKHLRALRRQHRHTFAYSGRRTERSRGTLSLELDQRGVPDRGTDKQA